MSSIKADYIDHIAIALNNIEEAEQLYEEVLGFKVKHRETIEDQRVKTSMLVSEQRGTSIELLEPIDGDSPISKFLKKGGEGVHHICLAVRDIESALENLKNKNIELIDEKPRTGANGSRVAFIHPRDMHGILIELAEFPKK